MNLTSYRLVDVTTKIGSGATPTGGKEAYLNAGVPLIRSLNVYDLAFAYEGLAFMNATQARKLSHVTVQENDVLLNITGASVARCCPAPKGLVGARVNQHVAIIRADAARAWGPYLARLLASPLYKEKLLATAGGGATREALTKSGLEQFEVQLPSLEIQRRYASILSAYDDLIENNTRRIAILEETARRIYDEWFVSFRAPGCEGLPLVDSSLGPIPQGWEVTKLGKAFDTGSGGTPDRKRPEYFGGSIPWVKTKELGGDAIFQTEEYLTDKGLRSSSAKLFPKNTVVIAMYGATIGEISILQVDAATNQACCAVQPRRRGIGWAFAYLMMVQNKQRLIGLRAGAAQQNVSQTIIRNLDVMVPTQNIGSSFEKACQPLLKMTFNLQCQNRNLRKQRDLVLPKLISGEIDVSEAEQLLEAAE